ncbi:unnamed protein product [Ectocarpus sp. 4 AP-2014]
MAKKKSTGAAKKTGRGGAREAGLLSRCPRRSQHRLCGVPHALNMRRNRQMTLSPPRHATPCSTLPRLLLPRVRTHRKAPRRVGLVGSVSLLARVGLARFPSAIMLRPRGAGGRQGLLEAQLETAAADLPRPLLPRPSGGPLPVGSPRTPGRVGRVGRDAAALLNRERSDMKMTRRHQHLAAPNERTLRVASRLPCHVQNGVRPGRLRQALRCRKRPGGRARPTGRGRTKSRRSPHPRGGSGSRGGTSYTQGRASPSGPTRRIQIATWAL